MVKNSQMEWTGVEFEIHGVKTQIHAPWLWKKFMVFGEIHKPPFHVKGHNYCFMTNAYKIWSFILDLIPIYNQF